MKTFRLIGIMSGTSLDGIDIASCNFTFDTEWNYQIEHAETIPYASEWKSRLANLHNASAYDFAKTDTDLGILIAEKVRDFIKKHHIRSIDAIASHGHTIFHQPEIKLTSQIGSGAHIAAITGIQTICDFRTNDVALGGQGAPLVPIGDEFLFGEYDYCINLGGIANISFKEGDKRKSFDLGFANIASNYLANQLDLAYDFNGDNAKKGKLNDELLLQLNELDYFQKDFPKSLGKEYFDEKFKPILDSFDIPLADKLHTIATQLSSLVVNFLNQRNRGKVLITGGGAYNAHWLELIRANTQSEIILPDKTTVDFKEALIFAFLGLFRLQNRNNCLSSVTGATKDAIGGCIYQ